MNNKTGEKNHVFPISISVCLHTENEKQNGQISIFPDINNIATVTC